MTTAVTATILPTGMATPIHGRSPAGVGPLSETI